MKSNIFLLMKTKSIFGSMRKIKLIRILNILFLKSKNKAIIGMKYKFMGKKVKLARAIIQQFSLKISYIFLFI